MENKEENKSNIGVLESHKWYKNGERPAAPNTDLVSNGERFLPQEGGLTKREHIATQVLQGLVVSDQSKQLSSVNLCHKAIEITEELLRQLEHGK